LERYYPVIQTEIDGNITILVSAVGAPHPYSIDTYGLRLTCRFSDGQERQFSLDNPAAATDIVAEAIIAATVPEPPTQCSLFSLYNNHSVLLHRGPPKRLTSSQGVVADIQPTVTAFYDATMMPDGRVKVDPALRDAPAGKPTTYRDNQGRIDLAFAPRPLDLDELLGIEVSTDQPLKISMNLISKDKTVWRYYPPLKKGRPNLILFSPVGFKNISSLEGFDRIGMTVYTSDLAQVAHLSFGRVFVIKNQLQLYNYFSRHGGELRFATGRN
jgi:hypothetical protein